MKIYMHALHGVLGIIFTVPGFYILKYQLVLPIFDYCDIVWAPPTALLSNFIERIHARFVSHLCNDVGFKVTLAECHQFCL